ncbi:hypothetical protein J3A83DRAFT_4380165 [Scleroderma citrinum]
MPSQEQAPQHTKTNTGTAYASSGHLDIGLPCDRNLRIALLSSFRISTNLGRKNPRRNLVSGCLRSHISSSALLFVASSIAANIYFPHGPRWVLSLDNGLKSTPIWVTDVPILPGKEGVHCWMILAKHGKLRETALPLSPPPPTYC